MSSSKAYDPNVPFASPPDAPATSVNLVEVDGGGSSSDAIMPSFRPAPLD